ncbi:MAG: thioredoxin domain-containing protein [Bacteroidetes bacterium]|nr:thioredoxin domain-containing protein [Bacteroidota bacterium]
MHRFTNELIHETSPYLLQHAHNPVNWMAWNEATLKKAKEENKLILVSIGYSACHWCHVMEHESFEDETTARMMNDHFICIKIDREERPDIDAVYMSAVQLMTQRGGWPLNCFTLPDGKPLYGGTYFPKERWREILLTLADLWKNDPDKCFDYAHQLTEGVRATGKIITDNEEKNIENKTLEISIQNWSMRFDNSEGGPDHAPKFPLPNNYLFLLRYAHLAGEQEILKHVSLTLEKMAMGGIYDQLGGGFARYSTDTLWKVPHFEKMLYDNAQLVSLYSEAYQQSGNALYKNVVYETLEFISRELTAENGAFYSALDADSEGEEGKYYVWTKEELHQTIGQSLPNAIFDDYFSVDEYGRWENGKNILLRRESDEVIAKKHGMSADKLQEGIDSAKKKLLAVRERRVRPSLDDKSLTSWNAMMLRAYVDAYAVFGEENFLSDALKNAAFIRDVQLRDDGGLWHSWKKNKSTINGFLEDHAFVIDAFIALYQVCFNEQWLMIAKQQTDYVMKHFVSEGQQMFYFTSAKDPLLITRRIETDDNVIPSSNSVMAKNIFYLGHFFGKAEWITRAERMLKTVQEEIIRYGAGYSNWMILQLHFTFSFREVAIVGNDVDKSRAAFRKHYLPNQIFAGSPGLSDLPLLQNRFVENKTLIYICENNSCESPVENTRAAIDRLETGTNAE